MTQQMLYPQEVEVFYLIPAIRKELAFQLKDQGKEQRQIAELLGITEAAISQYFSKKRAAEIKFGSEILKEIRLSSGRIKNKYDSIKEVQRILKIINKTREICRIHKKFSDVEKNCDICFK